MTASFRDLFYALAFFVLLLVILIVAKSILVPLSLALLLSFILYPIQVQFLKYNLGEIASAAVSLILLFGIIIGILFFFSAEILVLSDQVSDFQIKLMGVFTSVLVFLNDNVSIVPNLEQDDLIQGGKEWIKESGAYLLGQTFGNTAGILVNTFTTIVYTFLFLIYRKGLVSAFMHFAEEGQEEMYLNMLKNIQKVGQKYLSGMLVLIIILGVINSVGLWIIGLDSPFLFGFLAAILSIIPYIGTVMGAVIPVLYAFFSHDVLWVPLAVAGLFWIVQILESNFISPKVVGSSVNVNALAAIMSLMIGAAVWGIAGMVLFLPFTAMLKVICENYEQLKPLGMMISESHFKDD